MAETISTTANLEADAEPRLRGLRAWPRRRLAVLAALTMAVAALIVVLVVSSSSKAQQKSPLAGLATAVVAHRDLVKHDTVSGTLGYTDNRDVVNALSGTLTWLPKAGAVIAPGRALYRVDGQAVFLFDGATPSARTFEPGMTDGADVLELKQALRELGYDPGHQLVMTSQYDWATRAVVERWQQDNDLTLTGTIPLGQVVFQPGARRVGQLQLSVGSAMSPGQVPFQTSSSQRIVIGTVAASQQSDLQDGEHVSVDLLNGVVTSGTIVEIDKVATSTQSQSQQNNQASGGGGSTPTSTLGFQVRLDHPSVAGDLDQAPVNIDVASEKAKDALSVPVTALLAQQGGGYGVQIERGGTIVVVPVTPGFYSDNGYVQISGPIKAGDRVVVPQ